MPGRWPRPTAVQRRPGGDRRARWRCGGAVAPVPCARRPSSRWPRAGPTWRSTRRARRRARRPSCSATRTRWPWPTGELDPADALAEGRVRVRGDLAALVAGQECSPRRRPGSARPGGADRPDPRPGLTGRPRTTRPQPDVAPAFGPPARFRRALPGPGRRRHRRLARAWARNSAATWPAPARRSSGWPATTERLDAAGDRAAHASRRLRRTVVCDVADTDALRAVLESGSETHGPSTSWSTTRPGSRHPAGRHHRGRFPPHLRRELLRPGGRDAGRPARHARHAAAASIVNVSSDGGRLPSPGPGAYPSSKAALSAFSESTSFRLGPKGVHVHVVYPAFMATELGLGALAPGSAPAAPADDPQRRDGVTPDSGPGRRPVARDQRLGPIDAAMVFRSPAAPDLPPAAPELVAAWWTEPRVAMADDRPSWRLLTGSRATE